MTPRGVRMRDTVRALGPYRGMRGGTHERPEARGPGPLPEFTRNETRRQAPRIRSAETAVGRGSVTRRTTRRNRERTIPVAEGRQAAWAGGVVREGVTKMR